MSSAKTRKLIVDAARRLFAVRGFRDITIGDIAVAAHKGRRTVYSHFKNKEEIYDAVVESELDILSEMLSQVASRHCSSDEKLIELIFARLDTIRTVVNRNGNLRADFFRDIIRVENVRRKFDSKEIALIKTILLEGVEKKLFYVQDIDMMAKIIHYCVKGIEVPYILGKLTGELSSAHRKKMVADLVLGALEGIRPSDNTATEEENRLGLE